MVRCYEYSPARLAGVKHIYVVTPYHKVKNKRLFMACASICGVEYIYTLSGAQAIIALALGMGGWKEGG